MCFLVLLLDLASNPVFSLASNVINFQADESEIFAQSDRQLQKSAYKRNYHKHWGKCMHM